MYAINAYIDPENHPNVGIYGIHGVYGSCFSSKTQKVLSPEVGNSTPEFHVKLPSLAIPNVYLPKAPKGSQDSRIQLQVP